MNGIQKCSRCGREMWAYLEPEPLCPECCRPERDKRGTPARHLLAVKLSVQQWLRNHHRVMARLEVSRTLRASRNQTADKAHFEARLIRAIGR